MRQAAFAVLMTVAWSSTAVAQEVDTEIYGNFRYSYNRADAGDAGDWWASANNASRLGVRAEVSGAGLTAFADLQTGVNIDAEEGGGAFTQRYYLAGVRGSFGTLTVGRHSTAYKMAGLRLDPFYDSSTLSSAGGVPVTGLFAGASFGLSKLTNGWADRTVAYTSPAFGGLTANATAYVDTSSDHDYGVGLAYHGRGVEAGVQYHVANGGRTWTQTADIDHAVRGHAAYSRVDAWSLGASYERVEPRDGDRESFLYAAGTYTVAPRLMLAGGLGYVDGVTLQPISGTAYHAGAFYTLFPQARVHALYSRVDADAGPSRGNVALGLTYQFSIRP